jgi:hypothetical protein
MAKKTFTFWYDETYTYQVWFEAESLEEAQALLAQVDESEIEVSELPNVSQKDKNYHFEATDVSEWVI